MSKEGIKELRIHFVENPMKAGLTRIFCSPGWPAEYALCREAAVTLVYIPGSGLAQVEQRDLENTVAQVLGVPEVILKKDAGGRYVVIMHSNAAAEAALAAVRSVSASGRLKSRVVK
jgi:hypothetical protein